MRLEGVYIRIIESKLKVPRSTLSGWFKNLELSEKQKNILHTNWMNGLIKARKKAVKWHKRQKNERLQTAESEARNTAEQLNYENSSIELALSMLYLGEGFKNKSETGIGNSDPMILLFFITVLKKIFNVETEKITCHLHLRADQDPDELKKYWSDKLKIPEKNFGKASIDKRTIGKKTYDSYKGVCVVRCGNIAIQRKLIYLSRIYCQNTIQELGG